MSYPKASCAGKGREQGDTHERLCREGPRWQVWGRGETWSAFIRTPPPAPLLTSKAYLPSRAKQRLQGLYPLLRASSADSETQRCAGLAVESNGSRIRERSASWRCRCRKTWRRFGRGQPLLLLVGPGAAKAGAVSRSAAAKEGMIADKQDRMKAPCVCDDGMCVFFCQKNKRQGRRIGAQPLARRAACGRESAGSVPENETRKHVIPWISL